MDDYTKLTQKLAQANLELHRIQSEVSVAHYQNNYKLLRRALYKTNDSEMSQDLVQNTFLKTFLYLQKGGKIELMHSFLNHVLNDLIVDEYRKRKTASLDLLLEKGYEPGFNDFERDINVLDGQGVILFLPQLPKKYEAVIRLRYVKGLSLQETALITGQSENTVAVQVHRGLIKLKNSTLSKRRRRHTCECTTCSGTPRKAFGVGVTKWLSGRDVSSNIRKVTITIWEL